MGVTTSTLSSPVPTAVSSYSTLNKQRFLSSSSSKNHQQQNEKSNHVNNNTNVVASNLKSNSSISTESKGLSSSSSQGAAVGSGRGGLDHTNEMIGEEKGTTTNTNNNATTTGNRRNLHHNGSSSSISSSNNTPINIPPNRPFILPQHYFHGSYRLAASKNLNPHSNFARVHTNTTTTSHNTSSTATPIPIPVQYQNDPLTTHIQRDLPFHLIEQKLAPESGRMGSTFRIRHVPTGAVMILKVMELTILQPLHDDDDDGEEENGHGNIVDVKKNGRIGGAAGAASENLNSDLGEEKKSLIANNVNANANNCGSNHVNNAGGASTSINIPDASSVVTAAATTTDTQTNNHADNRQSKDTHMISMSIPSTKESTHSTTTATTKNNNLPHNNNKREYGSITQHELQMQENELKRILLLVASAAKASASSISSTTSSFLSSKDSTYNDKDDKEDPTSHTSNKNNHTSTHKTNKNTTDFTHAILPYQAWYVSPYNISNSSNITNHTMSATTSTNTTVKSTHTLSAEKSTTGHTNNGSGGSGTTTHTSSNHTHPKNNSNQFYTITKRPIYLLRPHVYTTLSTKIINRPFLSNAEKMYIAHQIISCVNDLHSRLHLCHGHLTCENIGLSSFHSVFLLDLLPVSGGNSISENEDDNDGSGSSSGGTVRRNNNRALRPLLIPDDDPSDWIYYFQERTSSSSSSTTTTTNSSARSGREKKCYVAPERFVSSSKTQSSTSSSTIPTPIPTKLTPAMDIFSLGCVLMELFLNGETAMDLGDLMEYRRINGNIADHSTLSKKLNKIESGKMRAAVRNMLHLDPLKRLSASEYLNRLKDIEGNTNNSGGGQTAKVVKSSAVGLDNQPSANASDGTSSNTTETTITQQNKNASGGGTVAPFPLCHESIYFPFMKRLRCQMLSADARIALAAIYYDDFIYSTIGIRDEQGGRYFRNLVGKSTVELVARSNNYRESEVKNEEIKPDGDRFSEETPFNVLDVIQPFSANYVQTMSADALIIFVQYILSTIRHTQLPSSKLVGIQLLCRISMYTTDEVRLQRIVPTLVSILHDTDATVRATSLRVLALVLSLVEHFPPSDAQIFPQYIFKKAKT